MRSKLVRGRMPWVNSAFVVWSNEDGFRHTTPHNRGPNRPVRLIVDPSGMYPRNGYFSVPELYFTAYFGYWPDGTEFEVINKRMGNRVASGKKKRLIQVQNGVLVDTLNRQKLVFHCKDIRHWVSLDE